MIDSKGIPLEVQRKANKLGYTVYLSHRKGKRFYVIYKGHKIDFGLKNQRIRLSHLLFFGVGPFYGNHNEKL